MTDFNNFETEHETHVPESCIQAPRWMILVRFCSCVLFVVALLGLYLVYVFGGFEYFSPSVYNYYVENSNYFVYDVEIVFLSDDDFFLRIIFEDENRDSHTRINVARSSIEIAKSNGIFNELQNGDKLQAVSTYMHNGPHNSISWAAEIKQGEKIFLTFTDGQKNILDDILAQKNKYITYTAIGVSFFVPMLAVFITLSIIKKKYWK